ncbi:hypothetical protein DFP74_2236 [Nocardiopsis sp. Huas11]|uniref:hypothetical protein n=1 Tax=Nocardiopsis sp. Huas11 TaxID=2183912 RepID=UPI000F232A30|nr:hypothetical protein [Nocardiopsis sp. Huas11]RKS06597.1 hypothetical protein DFP74_2236 [Nocardiopsis sp. Huas11]
MSDPYDSAFDTPEPESTEVLTLSTLADTVGLALIGPPRPVADGDVVAHLQAVIRAAMG